MNTANNNPVRVRYAPSPTGLPHVGNVPYRAYSTGYSPAAQTALSLFELKTRTRIAWYATRWMAYLRASGG